jgi:hypothetical protein
MSDQVLEALAQALAPHMNGKQLYGLGQKADGTPWELGYLYEQGGLFGRCDGPSTLINALVGPYQCSCRTNWF